MSAGSGKDARFHGQRLDKWKSRKVACMQPWLIFLVARLVVNFVRLWKRLIH